MARNFFANCNRANAYVQMATHYYRLINSAYIELCQTPPPLLLAKPSHDLLSSAVEMAKAAQKLGVRLLRNHPHEAPGLVELINYANAAEYTYRVIFEAKRRAAPLFPNWAAEFRSILWHFNLPVGHVFAIPEIGYQYDFLFLLPPTEYVWLFRFFLYWNVRFGPQW